MESTNEVEKMKVIFKMIDVLGLKPTIKVVLFLFFFKGCIPPVFIVHIFYIEPTHLQRSPLLQINRTLNKVVTHEKAKLLQCYLAKYAQLLISKDPIIQLKDA